MSELAPSILSADFMRLGEQLHTLEESGLKVLHVDVMDGVFVPSISFGMPVIKSIRTGCQMMFDVHLMIKEPARYIKEFVEAGADSITVHVEACSDIGETITVMKQYPVKRALSVNPGTDVNVLMPYLDQIDMVLVMGVEPGFGGQAYIPESTDKIRALRKMLNDRGLTTDIEVDGGIKKDNLEMVLDAGANVIVAGSAIFKDDIEKNTRDFMEILKKRQA